MDRNIKITCFGCTQVWSLSARRAWIEICYLDNIEITEAVALRKESVDRNGALPLSGPRAHVALRKESVDRNNRAVVAFQDPAGVALRKESVDRNRAGLVAGSKHIWSLSARRAWIEIISGINNAGRYRSLSARRAWIEILTTVLHWYHISRSLSARRAWIEIL